MTTASRDIARRLLAGAGADRPSATPPAATAPAASRPVASRPAAASAAARRHGLGEHPEIVKAVQQRELLTAGLAEYDLPNPFYVPHEGVNGATLQMFDGEFVNFSGYNYLGLAGDARVQDAAKAAIDRYGTSCSASRVVSGQIPLHRALEQRIAGAYGVDDAVVTGSGYLTNAAVIGFLLGSADLAVCDSLVHNSIVAGTQWAQCQRLTFRHNDPQSLDDVLRRSRGHFGYAMVILEGAYSMDGDIAVLPELVEVARRHDCLVMVDEAHSFGVLGARGFGVGEHHGVPGTDVDIWMGTLSKSLSAYGGFLAGSADLCEALRMVAPGISMFAAAPAPPVVGAALAAFDLMVAEPERLTRLRANSTALADGLRSAGVDVGGAGSTPIVPALLGGSRRTMLASQALLAAGVNANPIMYPAVAEGEARIRFFVTAEHTAQQIAHTVEHLAAHLADPTQAGDG